MGRRRRNRHGANGHIGEGGPNGVPSREDGLAPTYVTVRQSLWNAESDTPVLALEGLRPWEEIRGPSLLLEDDGAADIDALLADSHDPHQLDLTQLAAQTAMDAHAELDVESETATDVVVPEPEVEPGERPVLVLEPEPPVEVQAELPLVESPQVDEAVPDVTAVAEAEPASDEEQGQAAPVEPAPDPIELLYQDGRAAAGEGREAEARELYRKVLVERPAHIGARNNLALLLEAAGDQPGALAEFDRALDVDGENPTLLTNRGALLGAMGRYAAAERDLKKVLRIDPAHPEALFDIGVVMTKKGLWAEAVPQLRRAVELDPSKGLAYFYLGEALNHVDDLYGAMAAYQRASELMPSHPRALYGLGIVYDRLGRPEDAARMYRRSREVGRR